MIDQLTTQFYQNRAGEIFVIIQGWKNGTYFERLVINVENFKYSSEALYELALVGFDHFSPFNPENYGGHTFAEMLEQVGIESGESKLIANISSSGESEFVFESMDEHAKSLFSPILKLLGDV